MDRLSKSLTLFHAQVLEQLEKLWVTNGFDPGLLHVLKIMLIKLWRTSPSKSGSENHLPLLDLPLHCGAGMDGRGSLAKPVAFAWALLYTAIHLLDAVEDHLGMLLQIANDIAGLWGNGEQTSDIAKGKRTIPIVYALEILPAEDIVPLLQLIEEAAFNNEAEIRARCLVRNSGAVVYMLLEAEKHKLLAQDSLKELPLDQDEKEYLLQILESIMKPKIHEDFVLTR